MKKSFLLIALTFILIKSYPQNNPIDSLKFSTETGLLAIEGYLNGVKTNFAFVTGASMGALTNDNVKDSKITIIGSIKINDSQKNTAKINKAKIDSLRIGSQNFLDITSVVADMAFLQCNKMYLLGGDVINKLNWKFDFQKNVVYFSKTPFLPENKMTKMPFKIIGNRHFSNLNVGGTTIDNVLVDFGYAGNCTMDIASKSTKELIKNQSPENLYKSKSFSMGINSASLGKETNAFFVDTLLFGGMQFNNFKISAMPNTHNKIGLFFFTKNFSQMIINNTELTYWLMPGHITPQKTLIFDAGFNFNDKNKIEVVALNNAVNNSAKALNIGQVIFSINDRNANSFADKCEFMSWYFEQTKLPKMVIELLNGEKIEIKKSVF
ncbi:MAG: hypothetical protein EOO44_19800 [Flavobacterium sp.]|nr:MAG: hypothetical protein EOO44_19800 [Flavobacterium sp.]